MLKKIKITLKMLLILGITTFSMPSIAQTKATPRCFLSGDGSITISGQKINYRDADGHYVEDGLKRLNKIFQAPWEDTEERLSLRFLEIIDYVQDQLSGGSYALRSGYRSPQLNNKLRQRGKLAAQSSMHIEGAAADMQLGGVASSQVFDFIKNLDCCGIGWYHGGHFHLDTGPSRYWDETSSKTEDKTPQQNEKIIIQSDYDRYVIGETVKLKLMRVSSYPIGIDKTAELTNGNDKIALDLVFTGNSIRDSCVIVTNRQQARRLAIAIPEKMKPGKYELKIQFCNRFDSEKMPEAIASRSFEILAKGK